MDTIEIKQRKVNVINLRRTITITTVGYLFTGTGKAKIYKCRKSWLNAFKAWKSKKSEILKVGILKGAKQLANALQAIDIAKFNLSKYGYNFKRYTAKLKAIAQYKFLLRTI